MRIQTTFVLGQKVGLSVLLEIKITFHKWKILLITFYEIFKLVILKLPATSLSLKSVSSSPFCRKPKV